MPRFSPVEPWLPLTSDWKTRNVAGMEQDGGSILALYRKLLRLRREHTALRTGDYREILVTEGVFVFAREADAERLLVALNFTSHPREATLSGEGGALEPLLSTRGSVPQAGSGLISLAPGEGVIYRMGESRR